jgi:hypothetical protein
MDRPLLGIGFLRYLEHLLDLFLDVVETQGGINPDAMKVSCIVGSETSGINTGCGHVWFSRKEKPRSMAGPDLVVGTVG